MPIILKDVGSEFNKHGYSFGVLDVLTRYLSGDPASTFKIVPCWVGDYSILEGIIPRPDGGTRRVQVVLRGMDAGHDDIVKLYEETRRNYEKAIGLELRPLGDNRTATTGGA